MSGGEGFQLEPDLLSARITTLTKLGDLTGDLVATASRLAERLPMLGTAPPAAQLSERLRDAAGPSGLAGAVQAAQQEVAAFQQTLSEVNKSYVDSEASAESSVRSAGEPDGGARSQHDGGGEARS